jgi:hypothetical protein
MSEFDSDHVRTRNEFPRRCREYPAPRESLQVSEKGRGAAAQAAKVYADSHGYEYRSHSHVNHVVLMLARESRNRRVREWADSANSLDSNFYADWFDSHSAAARLDDVENLVDIACEMTNI